MTHRNKAKKLTVKVRDDLPRLVAIKTNYSEVNIYIKGVSIYFSLDPSLIIISLPNSNPLLILFINHFRIYGNSFRKHSDFNQEIYPNV